jgi:hypothetical protein
MPLGVHLARLAALALHRPKEGGNAMTSEPASKSTSFPLVDFELTADALERIAYHADVDTHLARRVLDAYRLSEDREARDLAIVEETIRRLELLLQRTLPGDLSCRELGFELEPRQRTRPRGPMPSVGPRHPRRF